MIPTASGITTDLELTTDIGTSKTYKLSADKIQGNIDGLEALEQAICKVLDTEKYEYPIYSFPYGIELENLIGKDTAYVKAEIKRRIKECLLRDERIKSVDNFNFKITGDEILCVFDVISIYDNLTITKEVST